MNFLEKDLEDIIFNSSNNLLQQKNLNINGIKKRQVRIGNYGIADIITISKPPYENIFPGDEEMAHNGEITITEKGFAMAVFMHKVISEPLLQNQCYVK